MKFYDYSVKKTLIEYFGKDTIISMRKPHESSFSDAESSNMIPLCWQYADEQALHRLLPQCFILKTILDDDTIIYLTQQGRIKKAYFLFMVTEDEPIFSIDADYVKCLFAPWAAEGYQTELLRVCIFVERFHYAEKGFRFSYHIYDGRGIATYQIDRINGTDLVCISEDPCWGYYYRKLHSVVQSDDRQEFECLFAPNAVITTGERDKETVLAEGIDEIQRYFEDAGPVQISFSEIEDSKTYIRKPFCLDATLTIYVSLQNLISEINVCELGYRAKAPIIQNDVKPYGSLKEKAPKAVGLRLLDPTQMHGYAIQLDYGGNHLRNLYLYFFPEKEHPHVCEIDGYSFTREDFESAKLNEDGSVSFRNNSMILPHLLYYRSYRQSVIQKTDSIVYEDSSIRIRSVFSMSPTLLYREQSVGRSWEDREEAWDPAGALLDENGNRTNDISLLSLRSFGKTDELYEVCVEHTERYGLMKKNGEWFAPPIYDRIDTYSNGGAEGYREINGKNQKVIITDEGKEICFDHTALFSEFSAGLYRFNVEEWSGDPIRYGFYYREDYDQYSDVLPGKWGFADKNGNIVVEPKYVFAVGFWNAGEEHSVVARFVDGELCWGVIDLTGTEVIPCKYPDLYCRWGNAVAFQTEKDGPYGLMDFDGTVLLEPRFEFIEAYDPKHRLVTAGEDGDHLGVYSLDRGEMIIPEIFDCVDYDEHLISCEEAYTDENGYNCRDRYFDYDGKEHRFDGFNGVYEFGDYLKVWKDKKQGLIDYDGNVIIPPVLVSSAVYDSIQNAVDNYQSGILITENSGLFGLSKVSGEPIIPEIYSQIVFENPFAICSRKCENNASISDELFTLSGQPVLSGTYRDLHFTKNSTRINATTPYGTELFEIEILKNSPHLNF